MANIDYYTTLGIDKTATKEQIKSAYKKLAKKYHPDVSSDANSHEKFKEVSQAYQILSDPEKRKMYDQLGHSQYEQAKQGGGFNQGGFNYGGGFSGNYEDIFGGFRDPMDIFSELFGGGFGRQNQRQRESRGEDLELVVKLNFDEAVFGTEKTVAYDALLSCPTCDGYGSKKKSAGVTACSKCGGKGQVYAQSSFLGAQFTQVVPCPTCDGVGQTISDPCEICRGSGRTRQTVNTTVKVPPGVDNGTQMRLAGRGNAAKRRGGSGDLYITFKVEKHQNFTRSGSNLLIDLPITIPQAVLGDTVEIPTLEGKKSFKVPPGTNHGQKFKLSGQGIQHLSGSGRGDIIITTNLTIPNKLSKEERALYEQLGKTVKKPRSFIENFFS